MSMNCKNYCLLLLLSCLSLSSLWAQETAIYKDDQQTYKRGMHFFEQRLYGKAQGEFDKILSEAASFGTERVPLYVDKARLYSGLTALYLGQPDAEKRLLYFINEYEPSPLATKAKLAIGNYYYNQKEYDLAIKYLMKISSLELTNEEIVTMKFQLGYCYFVKKKFKQAKALFQQIKGNEKSEYYQAANYYYGITAFFEDDYKDALESFKLIEKSSRYSKIVPSYICQIYFAQKRYDEVISYGEPLLDDNTVREQNQIAQLVGQAYYEKGDYARALPHMERYVSKSNKVPKEALYQLGYTQYKQKKYGHAIKNFEQLNAENSKLGQNALYNMADCYLKTGDKPAARSAFERAKKMNFDKEIQEDALINYAKLSYELDYNEIAIEALQEVSPSSTYYGEAQNLMSKIFLNPRNYDKNLEILRKMPAAKKTNKVKEAHQKVAYFRAIQLYKDGKYDATLPLFEESLKVGGGNTETEALAHFWKAETLFRKEEYRKSINEYDKSIDLSKLTNTIPANSSSGVAHYGIGYNYIKMNDYKNASGEFADAVTEIQKDLNKINDKYVTNYVYPDALLRAGDCYLFQRNYGKAGNYYKRVIDKDYPNADYAMYQQSLIKSMQDKPYEQIALLDDLPRKFPSSRYADDALYAKGLAYLNLSKLDLAKESFQELLNTYKSSEFADNAMLKMGLIAYSEERNGEALDYYKAAFRSNPQSDEAKDALAAIQEIYIDMGRPNAYFDYLSTVQGYKVDDLERDSITYKSAWRQYESGNQDLAIAGFTNYLEQFPGGMNNLSAHYYRGKVYFAQKKFDEALVDFSYIAQTDNPAYAEQANYNAALIEYHNKENYEQAFYYYSKLEKIASTEEILFEAQQYGMRSAFLGGKVAELPGIAERFMQNVRSTDADKAEANYYLGKAYLASERYEEAKKAFKKNIELSGEDAMSAEAHYQVAYIVYQQRDLDKAMELCFENNKEIPNYVYWLVKSFVLLGDIYFEKNDLFQAKATLQSVVDNYDGDQALLNEAKEKLAKVKKAEKDGSKIKEDTDEMEMIDGND